VPGRACAPAANLAAEVRKDTLFTGWTIDALRAI
jgi:hypothetical protein